MGEREPRTQGSFVAEGYGRDRGRRLAPPIAAGQPVAHFETGSKSLRRQRRDARELRCGEVPQLPLQLVRSHVVPFAARKMTPVSASAPAAAIVIRSNGRGFP